MQNNLNLLHPLLNSYLDDQEKEEIDAIINSQNEEDRVYRIIRVRIIRQLRKEFIYYIEKNMEQI